jgi:hypothetical protein
MMSRNCHKSSAIMAAERKFRVSIWALSAHSVASSHIWLKSDPRGRSPVAYSSSLREDAMACPTIKIIGKKIILLSGYQRRPQIGSVRVESIKIQAMRKLLQSASKNPDAVAFGYTAGRWMPAA